jgi:hypothetical protein
MQATLDHQEVVTAQPCLAAYMLHWKTCCKPLATTAECLEHHVNALQSKQLTSQN